MAKDNKTPTEDTAEKVVFEPKTETREDGTVVVTDGHGVVVVTRY
jgi:hypothetical protein